MASKWQVLTSVRKAQIKVRTTWMSATVKEGPCIGACGCSAEYVYRGRSRSGPGDLTLIPSFDDYNKLWSDAGVVINPFWVHLPLTMQNGKWFVQNKWFAQYHTTAMKTLDEQIVIWSADEHTRGSMIYKCIVAYVEKFRLLYALMPC